MTFEALPVIAATLPDPVPTADPSQLTFEALPAILVAGAIAAVLAYAMTPVAMRLAMRLGAIDEPDTGRRIHIRPIPGRVGWP